jgi:hypothetical protein
LKAGDTLAFCQGGSFTGNTSLWVNANCRANQVCTVRNYTPPWASGDEKLPRLVGAEVNMNDPGNADHEEGYQFLNLDFEATSAETNDFCLFAGNDVTDVLECNITVNGYGIGAYVAGSNPPNPGSNGRNARITLRGSRITNSSNIGFLGACDDCALEYNYFQHNGGADPLDHNIYLSGASDSDGTEYVATNERIVGNESYQSAMGTGTTCMGNPIVVHGNHDGLVIQDNYVHEDIGAAGGGCWGISVTSGYAVAEGFTNVTISRNTVVNVGNTAIQMASCQGCTIENNLVIQGQTAFGTNGIYVHYNGTRDPLDLPQTAVKVLNNTVYLASSVQNTGIVVGLEGKDYVIASNAVLGTGHNWSCFGYDLAPAAYYADHNLCWSVDGTNGSWEAKAGSLSAWQASSGLDMHSLLKDPMFKNAALTGYDFTPAPGSPLVGAGDPTRGATTDFAGKVRPTPPDIGAFQH